MIAINFLKKFKVNRKLLILITTCICLILILYLFRIPLLKSIGRFLRDTDSPNGTYDVAFVLSGNAYDRSTEALRLYKSGFFKKIVCTGSAIPKVLRATDCKLTEAELSASVLRHNGLSDSVVTVLNDGTSTREEGLIIKEYVQNNNIKRLLIISSLNHTRRIRRTISKLLNESTKYDIVGADDTSYDELYWWTSEDGLIAVNNEYIKLIYYSLKY
jgi:uncharacterized SAM-binding protein YcdF (DUF218 family)